MKCWLRTYKFAGKELHGSRQEYQDGFCRGQVPQVFPIIDHLFNLDLSLDLLLHWVTRGIVRRILPVCQPCVQV